MGGFVFGGAGLGKGVAVQLRNFKKLQQDLDKIKESTAKAVANTVKDMKSRAPGWVASAVTEEYNIKKSEIMPTSKTTNKQRRAGTVTVRGETIEALQLIYTGRLLTPTHFKMKPTARPVGTLPSEGKAGRPAKPYTVTAEVKKGQRKALGSRVFLGTNKGTGQIPFQRSGDARLPLQVIKTVSVPQMITNDKVAAVVESKLQEGLKTRLEHNTKRQLGTG